MSVYSDIACDLLDYYADMQMAEADELPTEEEMDEMALYYSQYYPIEEEETREDWVFPF